LSDFLKEMDDVYGLCSDPIKAYIAELSEKTKAMLEKVRDLSHQVFEANPSGQREFVEAVNRVIPTLYRPFFLKNRDLVLDRTCDISPLFLEYLKKSYHVFNSHWKDSQVPELKSLKS